MVKAPTWKKNEMQIIWRLSALAVVWFAAEILKPTTRPFAAMVRSDRNVPITGLCLFATTTTVEVARLNNLARSIRWVEAFGAVTVSILTLLSRS